MLTTAEQVLGNTVGDMPELGERPKRPENKARLPKREPVKRGDTDGKIEKALSTEALMPFGRQKKPLRHIFRHFGWKMHRVSTCRDAEIFLSENLVAVLNQ